MVEGATMIIKGTIKLAYCRVQHSTDNLEIRNVHVALISVQEETTYSMEQSPS
jgi:hypothetical protein